MPKEDKKKAQTQWSKPKGWAERFLAGKPDGMQKLILEHKINENKAKNGG